MLLKLLLLKLQLLVVLQGLRQLTEILPQSLVLESEVINLAPVLINLVNDRLVTSEEIQLGLDPVIFFV